MSDGGRRKVDGNDVFLLPNRRIRPNSTKMSTILLNFVDQIVDRFWELEKQARQLEKADTAPRISGHGTPKKQARLPKNTPLPTKSPSGDDLRRGGLVNQLL